MIDNINKKDFCKMKNILDTKKISEIVVNLLNGEFIIYGNFCRNILNNCFDKNIDVYCTIHQYIYFGNISLYEMEDDILCINFVNYLKHVLKNFENVFVNVTIMRNKFHRYISCNYDNVQINFQINDDIISNNFLCNSLRIYKKKNSPITTDDFFKFIRTNGCSETIELSMGGIKDISITEIIKNTRMNYVTCLHKYKKNGDKIYFIQTFYSCRRTICENNPFICNLKYKKIIKNEIYNNNIKRGLCPCEMKTFIREFIKLNNDGYKIKLIDGLIITYNDVIWPSMNNDLEYDNSKLNIKTIPYDDSNVIADNLNSLFYSNFSINNNIQLNSKHEVDNKKLHDEKKILHCEKKFHDKKQEIITNQNLVHKTKLAEDQILKNDFIGIQNDNVSTTTLLNVPLSPLLQIPLSPLLFPSIDELNK